MESYLVDRSVLEQVADALIGAKYPGEPVSAHAGTREAAIKALDHQILKDILGSLTREQGQEFYSLLDANDKEDSDPAVFENFFKNNDLDLQKIVENSMVKFRDNFMRGAAHAA